MTRKRKMVLGCFLVCMLALVSLALMVLFFGWTPSLQVFRVHSNLSWVEDHVSWFIGKNKRMPENWDELKELAKEVGYDPYISSHDIDSRIEINFEFMKRVNACDYEAVPRYWSDKRKEFWVYRLIDEPKRFNQERIMADFFYRLALSRAHFQCDSCMQDVDKPTSDTKESKSDN